MGRDRVIARAGRLFFAVALIAFGVQQFIYGDFIPGRAPPWPASWPGRLVWAYGSGALLVLCGAALALRRWDRQAAIVTGALIVGWALLRHIPLALADARFGSAWTKLGKAVALSGGAFAAVGFTTLGRVCLGAFLVLAGIQHFLWLELVTALVPAWIPGAVFWTELAGVALIAGGVGLLFPPTVRPAGLLSGLMIFTWLVILHVPRALAAAGPERRGEWVAVFEALAVSGIALLVSAGPDREPAARTRRRRR